MSKAQAARTFSVSLSSVKRYVDKANHGESLAPKKRTGAPRHETTASTPSKTPLRLSGLVASPVAISSATVPSARARAGFLEKVFTR
jgi:hypothetical protein